MRFIKRFLSALLVLVMIFTMLPLQAFAQEDTIQEKSDSATFGPQVDPKAAKAAKVITLEKGDTTTFYAVAKKNEIDPNDVVDCNLDAVGTLTITGKKAGQATVRLRKALSNNNWQEYTIIVREGPALTVEATIKDANVAYSVYTKDGWSSITELSSGTLVLPSFVVPSTNRGRVVFFVKGTGEALITKLTSPGANSDFYNIGGPYGNIQGYGFGERAKEAEKLGYQACFGYERDAEGLKKTPTVQFEVKGHTPKLGMEVTCNKTQDVIPGDELLFTITLTPDTSVDGKKLDPGRVELTGLWLNESEKSVNGLELKKEGTRYIVQVSHIATVEDCEAGEIKLHATASVPYTYTLNQSAAEVKTSVTVKNWADCSCQIGAKAGVEYRYEYSESLVSKPNEILEVPAPHFGYPGTQVTVKAPEYTEAVDTTNDGKWNFTGWTYNENTYVPGRDTVDIAKETITLTGTWTFTPNLYTVTYQYENGVPAEVEVPAPQSNIRKDGVVELPQASPWQYHTFEGWKYGDHVYQPGENFSMPGEDVTFIGEYVSTEPYTVIAKIYGANQGSHSEEDLLSTKERSMDWAELRLVHDMSEEELATYFWNEAVGSSGMFDSHTWNPSNLDKNTHTYIVEIFLKKTEGEGSPVVTLTYNGNVADNSVTNIPAPQKAIVGDTVDISKQLPDLKGYVFKGWYLNEEGTGEKYGGDDGAKTITLNESTTLYAKWERLSYNVTYQYVDPITNQTMEIGTDSCGAFTTVTVPADKAPPFDGYTFSGWEDTTEGAETVVMIPNEEGGYTFTMPNRNVTFTGRFTVPENQNYAVRATVKLGNEELATAEKKAISWTDLKSYYGMGADALLNNFWGLTLTDSTGMTFTWDPANPDAAKQYNAGKDEAYHEVTITLEENSPALVTLTYDANGGNGTLPETQTYLKGTKATVTEVEPTRTGYAFTGWKDKNGTPYAAKAKITLNESTTLYAQWELCSYNVIFRLSADSELEKLPADVTWPNGGPVAFGSTVEFADLNVPGYTFTWTEVVPEGKEKVTITKQDGNNTFDMPNRDVTFEGKFTKLTNLSYTVNYYWNGNKEKPFDTETTDGCTFGGSVELTDEQLEKAGYTLVEKPETLTIGADSSKNVINVYYRKNVTVTANSITDHKFGSEIPQLTARVLPAGVKLTTVYQPKTDADKDSPVDSYQIYFVDGEEKPINPEVEGNREPATVTEDNYLVTFVPGTLTITEADGLSISAEGGSWTYDGNPHAGTVTVKRGDEVVSAELSYRVKTAENAEYGEWTKTVPEIQNVGTLYVEVKASLDNYVEKTATYTLTVKPRVVTITAPQDISVVYGQAMPVLAPTVAPTVQELPDDFYETVDYDMVCEATSTSPAGEYPISFTRDGQTVEGLVKYGNYDVTFVLGKLIITKADGLSISAKGGSWTYDGEFHGDVDVDVNLPGATLTYSTDGIAYTEDVPTIRDVSESGKTFYVKAILANYKDDIAEYTLTVTPKLVTVTSASSEKVYDGTPLTAGMKSETGWVGEEGAEYTFHASVTNVTTGEGIPNTFSYEAKEGTNLDNYVIKMVNGTLKVNPKPIKVKADDKGMTYGGDVPALTARLAEGSALAERDAGKTLAEVIGGYTMNVQYKDGEPNVGEHSIAFADRNGVRGNYDVTFVSGTLTIQPAESLSVQPVSHEGIYDGQSHGGEAAVFVDGQEFTDATVSYYVSDSMDGPWEKQNSYPTIQNVGEFYVMVVAEHNNYNTAVEYAHLRVIPRTVTVTAGNAEKVYGDVDPTSFAAQVDGLLGGDTIDYQVARAEGEDVDKYDITPTGEQNQGNYVVQYYSGEFTINPKPIKVKADDKGMTYGGDVPALTAQLAEGSALADRDAGKTLAEVIGGYTMNVQYKDGEPNVGEHSIAFADRNGVRGNYDVTFVPGKLTIQPAESLSVQPVSYEGVYDGQSHGGEAAVFVKGEKFTDATVSYYVSDSMDGPWEEQNSYPTIQNVGEFYVMVVAEHNNYNTAVEYAHLRVIPRTVTVTAENAEKVYGAADPTSFAAQVDGLLGGDTIDYQVARAEGEDADKYDITPTGEQNQGNYVVQYYSGEFTINPKPIEVKADDKGMTYGGDVPALTAQLAEGSALAGRDAEKTLEAVIGKYTLEVQLPQDRPLVGRHTIDFTDEDGVRGNYLVTFDPGELTIEAPTPGEGTGIVTKTHENKTYNPGEWVRFTISAANIYNQPATLTIVEQLENVVFEQVENVTMAPGETLTFEAQYQVTEADILRGSLSNTIDWTIAPTEGSSIGGTVTDPVDLAGRNSAMTVEKTIEDQKDSYRVGDVISFQILVKNTGNVTLHNLELTDRLINANGRVTFTETNGASLSGGKLLLAQLAPGQQWTVKCSYTVTEADAGKNIGNAATVTPEDGPTITDETDKPAPVEQRYTLTIRYLNTAGLSIHPDYTGRYHAGDRYEIASPAVAGYTLTADSVVRSGVMGEGDKTLVVVYDRVPAPAPDPDPEPDPDPAPDPDPDPDPAPNPDPDAPAPDPDPDPEADPAQQTEPQDNTEPVLQPGTYLEDPEDHTLTPIDEEETPLANVNLNGHTCCILHFLLMLAAMVVYGFDTKSRKKHQARIFELKRQLAMKDDQNDSQQS